MVPHFAGPINVRNQEESFSSLPIVPCMEEKKKEIVDLVFRLLRKAGSTLEPEQAELVPFVGDGSQRAFYRLRFPDAASVVAIMPAGRDSAQMAEARSAWLIGMHLHRAGIPVPEPLAYDDASGMILFEDLGDLRLHDYLRERTVGDDEELLRIYGTVVRELVRMQVVGGQGFQTSWCWQTPSYDRELMLARESGYFLEALCQGLLRLTTYTTALRREFEDIADQAAAAPAHFFLHRDFQSRNLMLKEGRVRIIDFQGGRLGPLAYDLASLLIDPYVGLTDPVQDALLVEYLRELHLHLRYDPDRFREEYFYLALQRNLQILGAFAFLGGKRGKSFFLPFIRPALQSLQSRLSLEGHGRFPVLGHLVQTCLERMEHHGL